VRISSTSSCPRPRPRPLPHRRGAVLPPITSSPFTSRDLDISLRYLAVSPRRVIKLNPTLLLNPITSSQRSQPPNSLVLHNRSSSPHAASSAAPTSRFRPHRHTHSSRGAVHPLKPSPREPACLSPTATSHRIRHSSHPSTASVFVVREPFRLAQLVLVAFPFPSLSE
jgi:hypothetical protein